MKMSMQQTADRKYSVPWGIILRMAPTVIFFSVIIFVPNNIGPTAGGEIGLFIIKIILAILSAAVWMIPIKSRD